MITLPRAVEQNRYIRPIRLARYDPQPRDAVTISGWGQRHDNDREKFPLQEVTVDVMDNRNCNQYFNNVNGGMICTSGQSYTGACRGDSGGPLTKDGQLVGLVSFGMKSGQSYTGACRGDSGGPLTK